MQINLNGDDVSDKSESNIKHTVIYSLIMYFQNNSVLTLSFHLFYILMVCIFLSLSYVAAFHWNSAVTLYEEAHNASNFSNNFKMNTESDVLINSRIQKFMEEHAGMRAYIYRYHNGLAAISGVPFFFESNTHEVISPGSTRLLPFEQRIPASIHVNMNNSFIQDKCVFVGNTTLDKDSQNYYYYTSRGATSMLRCPIFMANGDVFGFVGIDWNHLVPEDTKMIDSFHALAKDLGILFANATKTK